VTSRLTRREQSTHAPRPVDSRSVTSRLTRCDQSTHTLRPVDSSAVSSRLARCEQSTHALQPAYSRAVTSLLTHREQATHAQRPTDSHIRSSTTYVKCAVRVRLNNPRECHPNLRAGPAWPYGSFTMDHVLTSCESNRIRRSGTPHRIYRRFAPGDDRVAACEENTFEQRDGYRHVSHGDLTLRTGAWEVGNQLPGSCSGSG